MCWGKKDDGDELPARPAQVDRPSSIAKTSSVPAVPTTSPGHHPAQPPPVDLRMDDVPPPAGPPASSQRHQQQQRSGDDARGYRNDDDFAPPPGPPPPRRSNGDYAPPPGPPPSNTDYAPPPGPPPSNTDYAPPPGPPPSNTDYAPPPGPPRPSNADYAPPPGPPPSNGDYAPPPGPPPSNGDYAPPPGPPPNADYAPPSGPPPSNSDYAAPPGPPPSRVDYTAPPPGPPPTKSDKPEHDWETLVPDTTLFPPPPDIFSGWDRSPAANATEAEAEAGERWCAQNPLLAPMALSDVAHKARERHAYQLMTPQEGFRGSLDWAGAGVWKGRTAAGSPDSCIIGYPPLYSVTSDSPLLPASRARSKTIYYEVRILRDSRPHETSLAIGYTALPYPSFRLPGWHRGSLGVHGDDGHRYVNDRWGGKSFVAPMKRGETYGLGIRFTADEAGRINVVVFFTKGGQEEGRWDLHEETDADQDLPVTGLEGFHDLSCAVGAFDAVSFEVVFDPEKWLYKGVN